MTYYAKGSSKFNGSCGGTMAGALPDDWSLSVMNFGTQHELEMNFRET